MSSKRLFRIVPVRIPVYLWSSELVASLRRRTSRIRSLAGLFASSPCLTTLMSIAKTCRRASSSSVRSLSPSRVSNASISASTCGLSLEKASCVASSLRSGGHRNRLANFSRTNDRTRSALESDHRRECVNRDHSFRQPGYLLVRGPWALRPRLTAGLPLSWRRERGSCTQTQYRTPVRGRIMCATAQITPEHHESAVNFLAIRQHDIRRIPLPRTLVNKEEGPAI